MDKDFWTVTPEQWGELNRGMDLLLLVYGGLIVLLLVLTAGCRRRTAEYREGQARGGRDDG